MKYSFNQTVKNIVFISLLLGFGLSLDVLADTDQYTIDAQSAKAYSDAYATRDIETLRKYLAEDVVFADPANHYQGREAMLKGLENTFAQITGSGPDGREIATFRSGKHFVNVAFIDFNMLLTIGEEPEREFNFKTDFTMILKVENGKIVQHTDYLDTEAYFAQLKHQIKSQ